MASSGSVVPAEVFGEAPAVRVGDGAGVGAGVEPGAGAGAEAAAGAAVQTGTRQEHWSGLPFLSAVHEREK